MYTRMRIRVYARSRTCIRVCAGDTVCFVPRSRDHGTGKGEKSRGVSGKKARKSVGHGGRAGVSSRPCREGEQPRYPGAADVGLGHHARGGGVLPALRAVSFNLDVCGALHSRGVMQTFLAYGVASTSACARACLRVRSQRRASRLAARQSSSPRRS